MQPASAAAHHQYGGLRTASRSKRAVLYYLAHVWHELCCLSAATVNADLTCFRFNGTQTACGEWVSPGLFLIEKLRGVGFGPFIDA